MKNKRFTSFILAACLFMSTAAGEPKNADKPMPSGPKPKDRPGFRFIQILKRQPVAVEMVTGSCYNKQ